MALVCGYIARVTLHILIWHIGPPMESNSSVSHLSTLNGWLTPNCSTCNGTTCQTDMVIDGTWIRAVFVVIIAPYVLTILKSLLQICFKSNRKQENRKETKKETAIDGKANDGMTKDGKTIDGKTEDGKAKNGKAKHGKANDGKTKDGKASDGKTSDEEETDEVEKTKTKTFLLVSKINRYNYNHQQTVKYMKNKTKLILVYNRILRTCLATTNIRV